MTESVITFFYQDPAADKLCTVVLKRKLCIHNNIHFTQINRHEYTEDLKYGDSQGDFIMLR